MTTGGLNQRDVSPCTTCSMLQFSVYNPLGLPCTIVSYPRETWRQRPGWAAATATRGCWTAAAAWTAAGGAAFCSASGSRTCWRRTSTCRSWPREKSEKMSEFCNTRGSPVRKLQVPKMAYFTKKYFSIWAHMKAMVMAFHMVYGNIIYSKRLLSDRPKRWRMLVEAGATQKAKK